MPCISLHHVDAHAIIFLLHSSPVPLKHPFGGPGGAIWNSAKAKYTSSGIATPSDRLKRPQWATGRDYRGLAGLRAARHGRLANRAHPPAEYPSVL